MKLWHLQNPDMMMGVPKKELPPEVLEYFKEEGRKGGSVGGKKYWKGLTNPQKRVRAQNAAKNIPKKVRIARAKKAGIASGKARRKQIADAKKASAAERRKG